jgi:hypothetical protein
MFPTIEPGACRGHATADELRRLGHEVEQVFNAEFRSFGPQRFITTAIPGRQRG